MPLLAWLNPDWGVVFANAAQQKIGARLENVMKYPYY